VWELERGVCLQILEEHKDLVTSVSVTPDGKLAISGSNDATCQVWDLEKGQCLRTLEGQRGWVTSVRVLPDGKLVVSGSSDKTCWVWEIETGKYVSVSPLKSGIKSVSVENADLHFICGTVDGDVVTMKGLNFPTAMPVVTPVRFWLFGDGVNNGRWADEVMTGCKWCGQRFPVPNEIFNCIVGITRNVNLSPDQSPCLELPDEAWEEPRLLSECPLCHKPLKYNPFIVDNRD